MEDNGDSAEAKELKIKTNFRQPRCKGFGKTNKYCMKQHWQFKKSVAQMFFSRTLRQFNQD